MFFYRALQNFVPSLTVLKHKMYEMERAQEVIYFNPTLFIAMLMKAQRSKEICIMSHS